MKCPECGHRKLFNFIICKKCGYDFIEKYRQRANLEQTSQNDPQKAWNTLQELLSIVNKKNIKRNPHGYHIFTMLGQISISLKKGRMENVIEYFETSYKLNPKFPDPLIYLMHIYRMQGRTKDAERVEDLYKRTGSTLGLTSAGIKEIKEYFIISRDPSLEDTFNNDALWNAAGNGQLEIVKTLCVGNISFSALGSALSIASQMGHLEIVKTLLNAGADPNHMEAPYNQTALITAAELGRTEVVEYLLQTDANVNVKDKKGWSALTFAISDGHFETVKILLEAGADVNVKNDDGWTSLIMASRNGYSEIVKLLIDRGMNVDEKDNAGCTALMHASGYGHNETVKALLRAGANVKAVSDGDSTVLMLG